VNIQIGMEVRVQLLRSATSDRSNLQFAMSYVINDDVAIDAGSLGFQSMELQQRIQHLFLTHCHLDHLNSFPLWLDNVFTPTPNAPAVYANSFTWNAIKTDLLNDRVWPDLIRIAGAEFPFFIEHVLEDEGTRHVSGLDVTPIPINHVVPTFGYLVDDGQSAVAFVSDTGPTERIWELARANPRLKGVFLEASFPERLLWLANKTGHLTPALAHVELEKLGLPVPVYFIHLKPQFHDVLTGEILDRGRPATQIVAAGTEFVF